tara:strand:- start:302 stop:442 length:141 start_codon:yes stop_codon:yes gene_type:complete
VEFINEKAMKIIFTLDYKIRRSDSEIAMRNNRQRLPPSVHAWEKSI